MNVHVQRALLLLKQHHRQEAKAELQQALVDDPSDATAHGLLALCFSDDGQHADATREAEAAIGLAPDMAFGHFALGHVLFKRHRFDEAENAVETAIGLDQSAADYFGLLANTRLAQKKWSEALDAADRGLARDAENTNCVNFRAAALLKLGRKEEAAAAIQGTLARDPEDADSHATLGWTLLDQRKPREALEHFREALRLEPNSPYARAGVVEALKARYRLYGLMLRYFLWMSRLSSRAQWGVILGGFFGMRALRSLEEAHPAVAAWTWPIGVVYVVFVLLTWLANPLFNLLLRLNKFGRYALAREQVVSSNWIGGCLALALFLAGAGLLLGSGEILLLAVVAGFSALPLSAVFNCAVGWPRIAMIGYTVLLAIVGAVGAATIEQGEGAGQSTFGLFVLGIFFSGFVANGLMMVRPKL